MLHLHLGTSQYDYSHQNYIYLDEKSTIGKSHNDFSQVGFYCFVLCFSSDSEGFLLMMMMMIMMFL